MSDSPYPNPDYDPQVHAERVRKWQEAGSDEKLRSYFGALGPQSLVLDLGGFVTAASSSTSERASFS